MKYFKMLFPIIGLVIVVFCGCSAVSQGPKDLEETAKRQTPPDDKALIYIVRPDMFRGGKVSMSVTINGEYLGTTGGKRFLYAIVDSGYYYIESKAGNLSDMGIHVESGKTYYIKQQIVERGGITKAGNMLVLLGETDGKESLAQCAISSKLTYSISPPRWNQDNVSLPQKPFSENEEFIVDARLLKKLGIDFPDMFPILDRSTEYMKGILKLSPDEVVRLSHGSQTHNFNTIEIANSTYRLTDGIIYFSEGVVNAWSRCYESR